MLSTLLTTKLIGINFIISILVLTTFDNLIYFSTPCTTYIKGRSHSFQHTKNTILSNVKYTC